MPKPKDPKASTLPDTLTAKQEAFCQAYVANGDNGTQAAISAGYGKAGAAVQALDNLRNPKIENRIAEIRASIPKKTGVTPEFVMNGLVEVYNRAMQNEAVKDHEGNPIGEYRFQGQVANKSLELMGRTLSMFVDRKEITGKDGTPLHTLTDEQLIAIATGRSAGTA